MSDSEPTLLSRVRESRDAVRLAENLRASNSPRHTVNLIRQVIEVEVVVDGTGGLTDHIALRIGVPTSVAIQHICELHFDRTHWALIAGEVERVLTSHDRSHGAKEKGEL